MAPFRGLAVAAAAALLLIILKLHLDFYRVNLKKMFQSEHGKIQNRQNNNCSSF
jgi:hypothetical protein